MKTSLCCVLNIWSISSTNFTVTINQFTPLIIHFHLNFLDDINSQSRPLVQSTTIVSTRFPFPPWKRLRLDLRISFWKEHEEIWTRWTRRQTYVQLQWWLRWRISFGWRNCKPVEQTQRQEAEKAFGFEAWKSDDILKRIKFKVY